MGGIAAIILLAVFTAGFAAAGRYSKGIVSQMVLGVAFGIAAMIGLVAVIFGVGFAGCLLLASQNR